MAKQKHDRRARHALNLSRALGAGQGTLPKGQQLTGQPIIDPTPRRVASAHKKHLAYPQGQGSKATAHQLTLAEKFHALPAEVREIIFAHLIVQPAKWHLRHNEHCPLRTSTADLTPCFAVGETMCVARWGSPRGSEYFKGHPTLPAWRNPWRSKWAPEVRNGLMCSTCWDKDWREQVEGLPFPSVRDGGLPCLCARRQNLEVLLVCRKWYEEAGRVFYSRNTFAFEDTSTFTHFINSLQRQHRDRITSVSVMAYVPPTWDMASSDTRSSLDTWEGGKQLQQVWSLLRTLPSLTYLELDALFLTRPKTIERMTRLGLRNLRTVRFMLRRPGRYTNLHGNEEIWPQLANAVLLRGGLAEEIARSIGCERRAWLKRSGALENAVERQTNRLLALEEQKTWPPRTLEEHNRDDLREWERLWWSGERHCSAFLPHR